MTAEWKNMKSRMIGFMEECRERMRMLSEKRHAVPVQRKVQSVAVGCRAWAPWRDTIGSRSRTVRPRSRGREPSPSGRHDPRFRLRHPRSSKAPYARRDNKARKALAALIRLRPHSHLGYIAVGWVRYTSALRYQCSSSSTVPARPLAEGMSEE